MGLRARQRPPHVVLLAISTLISAVACKKPAPKPDAATAVGSSASKLNDETGTGETDKLPDLASHPFPLVVWAVFLVERDYFDPSRFDRRAQLRWSLDRLGRTFPGFSYEMLPDHRVALTAGTAHKELQFSSENSPLAWVDFLTPTLTFLRESLYLSEAETHKAEYAALNGLFAALDPHTILLTPEEHDELGTRTRGRFGGIGAVIRREGRGIRLERVLPDMPADKAGLQSGDVLVAIAGRSTIDMSASDAQDRLRGAIGTSVKLKVRRQKTVLEITVVRGMIRVPALTLTALPDQVAYVQLTTFQEECAKELLETLEKNKDSWKNGIVFDLQGNSGGLLNEALELVDLFVPAGEIISVHSATGREAMTADATVSIPAETPLVILVDEHSASAAEIVAGSLQQLARATVIGRRSFGKGSVQRLNPASPYGQELALKTTIAEYRVANDKRIQTIGVRPDLELIPIFFDPATTNVLYYDTLSFERSREIGQTAKLPSAKHDQAIVDPRGDNELKIRYLEDRSASPDIPTVLRDPEVRIAHELSLDMAQHKLATASKPELADFRAKQAAREDEKLVAAFKAAGINWQGELDQSQSPTFTISAAIESAAGKSQRPSKRRRGKTLDDDKLHAGDAFEVEVTLTNTSDEVAHRVHLITACNKEELDRRELLFGEIAPHKSATRRLLLEIDPSRPAFREALRLEVHAGEVQEKPDASLDVTVDVAAAPLPKFALDWWIVDDATWAKKAPKRPEVPLLPGEDPFVVRGNADGYLQSDEHALLAVRVYNLSDDAAEDPQLILRNRSAQQGLIEEDRIVLPRLAAHSSTTAAFGIDVSAQADASKPFDLELLAGDGWTRAGLAAHLKLPLNHVPGSYHRNARPQQGILTTAAQLFVEPDATSAGVASLAAGQVLPIAGVSDHWVAVSGAAGQRLWLQDNLVKVVSKPARALSWSGSQVPQLVGPSIALELPTQVTTASLALRASISDDRAVRDVVVWLGRDDEAFSLQKTFYQAQLAGGEKSATLELSTDIHLQAGSNFIRVVARDNDELETVSEYWVNLVAATADSTGSETVK